MGGALAWEGHGGLLRGRNLVTLCMVSVGWGSGGQVSIRPSIGSVCGVDCCRWWGMHAEHGARSLTQNNMC